jgi:hypothetical protein
MPCLIAYTLFQEYAKATIDYFEATDNLAMLVGQHDDFAEAKKHTDRTHTKCRAARLALEQHWKEHGCRDLRPSTGFPPST